MAEPITGGTGSTQTGNQDRPCDPDDLRLLARLEGTWKNEPELRGRGWNMIALPFATQGTPFNFRLLLNQYDETLTFENVGGCIPNRGIEISGNGAVDTDQFIAGLDYQQSIAQIHAEDRPASGRAGERGDPIHHEPGLFLAMKNHTTRGHDIARLGTIPHGNALLALGNSSEIEGPPVIPDISGLPIGVDQDLNGKYLEPYRHYRDDPFRGRFDPTRPNALLRFANARVDIARTTQFEFDSTAASGGILNIPFIERQADTTEVRATFWVQELEPRHAGAKPELRLQYSQVVMLDFFDRTDGEPGLIKWPHVSINTMVKVED